ncbi:toxin regulator [Enterocloster lavalensis]|uniref:toxin regulator n=1 Tax=Enterocloster lavalensis TaxID=460384 RepID=UPI0023EFFA4C|nr:toxin regulator [Enterocloster lavalensis]
MKKRFLILILSALTITACNAGVTQSEYEAISKEAVEYSSQAVEYSSQAAEMASKYYDQQKDNRELTSQINSVKYEFDKYKESMSEYEGVAAAEAQARQIEAESIAASKAAEEESALAASRAQKEEERKAAEEEKKHEYETGITYEQLARNPDNYKNKKIKFSGTVLQVLEGSGDNNQIRLAINDDYGDILFCEYNKKIVSSRILENDHITVYGISYGLYSYTSTMGTTITVPAAILDKIDQ